MVKQANPHDLALSGIFFLGGLTVFVCNPAPFKAVAACGGQRASCGRCCHHAATMPEKVRGFPPSPGRGIKTYI